MEAATVANTIHCPHCGTRLDVADGAVERTMIESSGKPREWVLRVDRVEVHRCAVDSQRALAN
jgi:hypothetical protein